MQSCGSWYKEEMKQSCQSCYKVRFWFVQVAVTQLSQATAFSICGVAEYLVLSTWLKNAACSIWKREYLSPACISLESMLLPWIWYFFFILWFYDCFIFEIILHYQYPQKNSSRCIENSILIPCNQKGSRVFIAGRPVKKPVSLEDSKSLMISPLEEVPFLCQLPPKSLLPVFST